MAIARSSLSRRLHSLLFEPQSPLCIYHIIHSTTPPTTTTHQFPPFHHRTLASSSKILNLLDNSVSEQNDNNNSLYSLFNEPTRLRRKTENDKTKGKHDPENMSKKKSRPLEGKAENDKTKGKDDPENESKKKSRPLKGKLRNRKAKMKLEAVGLSKETGHSESQGGVQSHRVNKEVKKKLRRSKAKLKGKEGKGIGEGEKPKKVEAKRLYDLFNVHKPSKLSHEIAPVEKHKEVEQKEPVVLKELSPEMGSFVYHLYKEGYFKDANFFKRDKFDPRWFDTMYARKYMLFAAQKFGNDKQEISKWLSGSDLKHLAMFGCPSVNKSVVIPAKRLRYFFKIPEESVCSKCKLRDSCSFVNKKVWTSRNNTLDLALAMKIICSYALLFVHPQLVLPDETKNSVGRLLKEVQKLSRTVC